MLSKIYDLFRLPRTLKNKQRCWVYCPTCRNEMVACEKTKCEPDGDGGVYRYVCGDCGQASRWLFDNPVPLLL